MFRVILNAVKDPALDRRGMKASVATAEDLSSQRSFTTETLRDCLNGDLKVVSYSLGMTEASGALCETKGAEQYPSDFEGIGYEEIISRLEEQLGGRPEHGARNSFIFTMACNLRYICNDGSRIWLLSERRRQSRARPRQDWWSQEHPCLR